MDSLIIGPSRGIADAVAGALRRRGLSVLRAIAADARDAESAQWLLDEAGGPSLIVVVESAPFAIAHELLALTSAHVVLVAEQRAAAARPSALPARSLLPRDEPGLTVVARGRAGRRWFELRGRHEPMGAERAAAVVLRSCGAGEASFR
jgi:hypothetical protein